MDNSDKDVIRYIESDEFYKYFVSTTTKAALNYSLDITDQVKKLGEGIELLSQELQKQVLEKYDDLLQQASHATKLEGVLNTMNMHIQSLFANAERLKAQIVEPYNEIETHTKVLSRLHLASHILRQVNRMQQLSKRLITTNDTVQKATILQELEQLGSDLELKDIDVVTTELRNIRVHQQKVVQLATGLLNQGIINENATQTTTALQIFINLGKIQSIITSLLAQHVHECQTSLKLAFDVNKTNIPTKSKGPGRITLTSQGFRNKVWVEIEKAFSEDFYQICKQIKFLQVTCNGLNMQNIEVNVAFEFWTQFGEMIKEEICASSSAVHQMLEEEYPKLLKYYYDLTKKLNYNQFAFYRNVLRTLETSYLSGSLSRLLDPAQSMFNSENNVPSHDKIDSLIRVISSELSVALIEEQLSEQISKNVAKAVKMFAVKTEQQLETGPEAAQVIGGTPNSGQQKNVNLANALYYLQMQMSRMLGNMKESLSDACLEIINNSLQSLDNLVVAIVEPLVASINSVIETILITIHVEPDWTKLPTSANKSYQTCSPYMRELTQFVIRVHQTYLMSFESKQVLFAKCSEIAIRCIELFVRHSSLLRPITQGGRLRLQSDYTHLENSLKVICSQLQDLGRPYRLLKSMASLVTLTPEEIVAGQISGSTVPHSTILLMLFAFAGPDLTSPHQNTGWSLPKLSVWLDEHIDEEERLELVAGALQSYEYVVRQRNSVNYDPVYPIMSQFLENAIKTNK